MNNRNTDSINNYIWDCFIKSFENAEALLEDSLFLTQEERFNLLGIKSDKLCVWKKLYNERKKYLLKHVSICFKNKCMPINRVEFHEKFGWIVSYNEHSAYLGKSSIYGKLQLEIGENSYFSGHSILRGAGLLKIGKYCSFAFDQYINVSNQNHPINQAASIGIFSHSRLFNGRLLQTGSVGSESKSKIIIGDDVWFGRNSSVFTGVTVGTGAVVGADSLITKDCEPYGIYVGKPAKLIRYRFEPQIIKELLEVKWWDWSEDKISKNIRYFNTDLSKCTHSIKDLIKE